MKLSNSFLHFPRSGGRYKFAKGAGSVLTEGISPMAAESAAATAIPPAAIQALRSGKGTAKQFDEYFGAGSAARVLGEGK